MKIGSLVECIKEVLPKGGNELQTNERKPIKGKIYTIREIKIFPNKQIGITVEEIINPFIYFIDSLKYTERKFNINNFREILPPIENIEEKIKEETLEIELV